ncbi:MAG: hypothetical protein U0520_02820 [Candidatus Saccharimonadales bacterium]
MLEFGDFPIYWLPESEEDSPVLELFSDPEGLEYIYARPNSYVNSHYAMARIERADSVLVLSDLQGAGWSDDETLDSFLNGAIVYRRAEDTLKNLSFIEVHTHEWAVRMGLFERGFTQSSQNVMRLDLNHLRSRLGACDASS